MFERFAIVAGKLRPQYADGEVSVGAPAITKIEFDEDHRITVDANDPLQLMMTGVRVYYADGRRISTPAGKDEMTLDFPGDGS